MESFCQSYAGSVQRGHLPDDNEAYGAMTAMDNAGVSYAWTAT